ncbi:SulP family inorganic anion transporter [Leptolinea tardivitalis]|uniref:Sulfate permease n=1 Tax=Leptolinea tardivitalis TaxID=229920 RepID=A0A0P6WZP0_9CHLR|nr:SulP family inorganic anion transporter [Leptolinea tardivitalis]KPL74035.1 sulfate permease [Leptolinea tardivitalis]GAP22674.1 sulfate permease [Leptolinea tardivitalis]
MTKRTLIQMYREEFTGYTLHKFRQDLLAGLTVAAVALPLALAFGVVSGATASAGMVTAILSGLIIGGLSGAPYQISGPTGAMSAVLIVLAQKYGLPGVWVAGVMAGIALLIIGLLRLGRFIAYIPAPVITGFTSGIAAIIAIGQIDNLLGVKTAASDSSAVKLLGYFKGGYMPDWHTLVISAVVMVVMVAWPKKWNAHFPSSLVGIIAATGLNALVNWPVAVIGAIPQSLLLEDRLTFQTIPWGHLQEFIGSALTITALGAVESLLCGAVASNMTGIRLQANQELIAQGVGNLIIPFFGGVPATAAIARSSVGIKSGGKTRMVSLVHALVLMASMFFLAPVMSRIPLAALAGVLVVTAWRMNEWEAIRYIFRNRFKTAIITFLVTLLATVALDLTQAIMMGALLSAMIFLNDSASMDIQIQEVDPGKLRARGIENAGHCRHVRVAYLTGPLFFAATGNFNEAFANITDTHVLILSMRGVPLIDTSGMQALNTLHQTLRKAGIVLMLASVQPAVHKMLIRGGLEDQIGAENIFWSADQAIVDAEKRGCMYCAA